jgi:LacI family transcriptional regulator/LacI family purine nucleotide synthesis repressor
VTEIPTIIDIARLSGVSKSTVSRVLSGGSCKASTKQKILDAAQKLNYQPNRLARAMITKKTGIIGIIIYRKNKPFLSHPFYGEIIESIAKEAKMEGYSIIMMADDEINHMSLNQLIQYRVDGLILIGYISAELINLIKKKEIPYVLINNSTNVENATNVINDDYNGAYDAAIHLIQKGYINIAYLSGPIEHMSYKRRLDGFQAALHENGLRIDQHNLYISDSTAEGGKDGAMKILQSKNMPDAVFASNDMMAIGALQVFNSAGLKIPNDIAVMGFDDIYMSQYTVPPLSTVHVDKIQIGSIAMKKLYAMMNDDNYINECTVIPAKVVIRNST